MANDMNTSNIIFVVTGIVSMLLGLLGAMCWTAATHEGMPYRLGAFLTTVAAVLFVLCYAGVIIGLVSALAGTEGM